jgi:uncharacterized protein YggT (Ycf19 family)
VIAFAVTRGDVADYLSALFLVYFVLILLNILLSWIPRMPYRTWLRPILDFITETTNPYLNFFRRFTRPVGPIGLDIAPILAILVHFIAEAILVRAILE